MPLATVNTIFSSKVTFSSGISTSGRSGRKNFTKSKRRTRLVHVIVCCRRAFLLTSSHNDTKGSESLVENSTLGHVIYLRQLHVWQIATSFKVNCLLEFQYHFDSCSSPVFTVVVHFSFNKSSSGFCLLIGETSKNTENDWQAKFEVEFHELVSY